MNPETGRKRRLAGWPVLWAGLFVGVLAAELVWTWFSAGTDVFKVDGLPFREWVARRPDSMPRDPPAKLGTNGVPYLVRILHRQPESAWTVQFRQGLWDHLPKFLQARHPRWRPIPDSKVQRTALFVVRFFGPEARAALPDILRIARTETNLTVRASALVAALNVAPQAPGTFELWRAEWEHTNHFSRHDLALYLGMPRVPIPAAVPYLLAEMTNRQSQAMQPVLQALELSGDAARPAIRGMIRLFEGGVSRADLLPVFKALGPLASEAVPALAAFLKAPSAEKRLVFDFVKGAQVEVDPLAGLIAGTLSALQTIGPEAKSALPVIAPFLTNRDPTIRFLAAGAQVRLGGSVEEAMPILLAGLDRQGQGVPTVLSVRTREPLESGEAASYGPDAAAIICGELGGAAIEALPALERRLEDQNPWLRISAAQAVWRISHDPKKSLPTLVALLDSITAPGSRAGPADELLLVRAIEVIAEMGPAAKAAVPSLRRAQTFSTAARHAANATLSALNETPD
jgi:HEAT repeat protein